MTTLATRPTLTAAAFREARKRWGLNQSQMAEALGLSGQVQISRMESGDRPISGTIALLVRCIDASSFRQLLVKGTLAGPELPFDKTPG